MRDPNPNISDASTSPLTPPSAEEKVAAEERPHPADYLDHRVYLTEITAHLKRTISGFSYRAFSHAAGFAAPNVLKLAADGDRSIAARSIEKFAVGLGLTPDEHNAFEALVHFSQATSDVSKTRWYQRLLDLRARRELSRGGRTEALELEARHFEAYSRWHTMMLRELMLWPEFIEDPQALARLFRSKEVGAAEVKRGLELLEQLGLSVRDEEGRLAPAQAQIKTAREVDSLAVRNFHHALLEQASESLDQVDRAARNVSGLSLSLTLEQYEELTRSLADLRQELLRRFERAAAPRSGEEREEAGREGGRVLYHLSLALFPITHPAETLRPSR